MISFPSTYVHAKAASYIRPYHRKAREQETLEERGITKTRTGMIQTSKKMSQNTIPTINKHNTRF